MADHREISEDDLLRGVTCNGAFTAIECSIDKLYDTYIAQKLEEQYKIKMGCKDSVLLNPSVSDYILPSEEQATARMTSPADVVIATQQEIERDFAPDIEAISRAWETTAKAMLGEQNYNKLVAENGGDLGGAYIRARLADRLVSQAAELATPHDSQEFAVFAGKRETLCEQLARLSATNAEEMARAGRDALDATIYHRALKRYDPTFSEKLGAGVVKAFYDLPITLALGGSSSIASIPFDVVIEAASIGNEESKEDENSIEVTQRAYSKILFNTDENVFKAYREDGYSLSSGDGMLQFINREMKHHVVRDMGNIDDDGITAAIGQRINIEMPQTQDVMSQVNVSLDIAEKFGSFDKGGRSAEEKDAPRQYYPKKEEVEGWGNYLSDKDMSLFGDVGKNLGYTIAMLPDILIGMFTGQNKNLQLKDNLLPLAAIIGSLFVKKNSLVKLIMLGFGGAGLLSNANKALVGEQPVRSQRNRLYRDYLDEPLNERITHLGIKGNTILMDIDGHPNHILISDEAADAYANGHIPLNTLANAVLRKYDSQANDLSASYEREMAEGQTQEATRVRGIQ